MLGQLRANLQRIKPQSASVRNVLKLAGGTAGSQVIAVAAAPLLTRLYGPESFGILATFSSILALLNVVSSLRYELAIAVPEDDDEAIALVWLCFVLVGIATALTAVGVTLLGNQLVSWLHQPALKSLLWLLPVGVLLTGLYQPLSYWAVRRQQFGLLATTKFQQSLLGLSTSFVAAPLGPIGLLLGQIIGQSSGFVAILKQSFGMLIKSTGSAPVAYIRILHRYNHFGVYSSPAGLINLIGSQIPNLIFASKFGAADLGQLFLAQRLLLIPISLVSTSVSQILMSQAAKRYRDGTLIDLVQQASIKLSQYALTIGIIVSLVVGLGSRLILGEEWNKVAAILIAMVPLVVTQMSVSPLSFCFDACEKNSYELKSQIFLATARLAPLCALLIYFERVNFMVTIAIYFASSSLGYLFCRRLLMASVKLSH